MVVCNLTVIFAEKGTKDAAGLQDSHQGGGENCCRKRWALYGTMFPYWVHMDRQLHHGICWIPALILYPWSSMHCLHALTYMAQFCHIAKQYPPLFSVALTRQKELFLISIFTNYSFTPFKISSNRPSYSKIKKNLLWRSIKTWFYCFQQKKAKQLRKVTFGRTVSPEPTWDSFENSFLT